MSRERKPPAELIITSHGDPRTRPVGEEGKRANWAQLWAMKEATKMAAAGMSPEEILEKLSKSGIRVSEYTATATPEQLRVGMVETQLREETGESSEKAIAVQGVFFAYDGDQVLVQSTRPGEGEPQFPTNPKVVQTEGQHLTESSGIDSPVQMRLWEDI